MRKSTAAAAAGVLLAALASGAEKKLWKDLYVTTGDIKVHYLEAGTGTRHMVFIPGWTMAAEVWREQIPYFAARGFHVLALDPRVARQHVVHELPQRSCALAMDHAEVWQVGEDRVVEGPGEQGFGVSHPQPDEGDLGRGGRHWRRTPRSGGRPRGARRPSRGARLLALTSKRGSAPDLFRDPTVRLAEAYRRRAHAVAARAKI